MIKFTFDGTGVPKGTTKDDIKQREVILKYFYRLWTLEYSDKRVFNRHLQKDIYVKFLSINETVQKASRNYKWTIAVFRLTEILRHATLIGETKPKPNAKQKKFTKMLLFTYKNKEIGTVKLTVGVLKNGNNIQYCITTLE